MPISPIVLQRRHAELGRIRLGDQVPVGTSGKSRPNKLSKFRITSVSQRYIVDIAALYGGEAKPWDNNGIPSWEVYTDAQSIPVIAVKGGLSQWLETWSGGGCIHRCDGENNVLTGEPCDLSEQVQVGRETINPHEAARPTTRLSVMLVELEAIGVFRLETHGWNAAAEIPAVAELAQYVGDLVPANLHLIERRTVKDGKTSRFVVPVLDLQIGTQRLKEIAAAVSSGQPLELVSSVAHAALESLKPDYLGLANSAGISLDGVRAIWMQAKQAGDLTDALAANLKEIGDRLQEERDIAADSVDRVVDAEIVRDADEIWGEILKVGGGMGMGLADLNIDFAQVMGGLEAGSATAGELQVYLDKLQASVSA